MKNFLLILLINLWLCFPAFSATYYVRGDADGAGNGTTDANSGGTGSWTMAQFESTYTQGAGNICYFRGRNPSDESTFTYTLLAFHTDAVDGTAVSFCEYIGFWDTAGDVPTESQRPILALGAYAFTNDNYMRYKHISWTGSYTYIVRADDSAQAINCKFANGVVNKNGFQVQGYYAKFYDCEFTGTGFGLRTYNYTHVFFCNFHDMEDGIRTTTGSGSFIYGCIFDTLSSNGFESTSFGHTLINNTFYNITGDAVYCNNNGRSMSYINNIFYNNGDGIVHATAGNGYLLDYNCFNSNSGNDVTNVTKGANTSSADPQFTNAAAGDFSIGTNLKAAGYSVFPGGLSTGYLDIGAVQREEAGGAAAVTTSHGHF